MWDFASYYLANNVLRHHHQALKVALGPAAISDLIKSFSDECAIALIFGGIEK